PTLRTLCVLAAPPRGLRRLGAARRRRGYFCEERQNSLLFKACAAMQSSGRSNACCVCLLRILTPRIFGAWQKKIGAA
ncbi:hypothetical protein P3W70_06840, partial [Achromobacter denitrificans]|uniref:hypothetical protein n=1 Tax=Achromobacter denitrificans TaxID=32002 RepID=UPI0023E87F45